MKRLLLAVVVLSAAMGAAAAVKKTRRGKGLRKGRPGINRWSDREPGSTRPLPRPYPGAPPLVPHGVTGLSITRKTNNCLDCHLDGMDLGDGHTATKVPSSHSRLRYQCLQCQAPQAEGAAPPVGQKTPAL
mgnify:CR=1 FL=1